MILQKHIKMRILFGIYLLLRLSIKTSPLQYQKQNSPDEMPGEIAFRMTTGDYDPSAETMRPAFIGVSRKRIPIASLMALPTVGTGGTIGTSPTPRTRAPHPLEQPRPRRPSTSTANRCPIARRRRCPGWLVHTSLIDLIHKTNMPLFHGNATSDMHSDNSRVT